MPQTTVIRRNVNHSPSGSSIGTDSFNNSVSNIYKNIKACMKNAIVEIVIHSELGIDRTIHFFSDRILLVNSFGIKERIYMTVIFKFIQEF